MRVGVLKYTCVYVCPVTGRTQYTHHRTKRPAALDIAVMLHKAGRPYRLIQARRNGTFKLHLKFTDGRNTITSSREHYIMKVALEELKAYLLALVAQGNIRFTSDEETKKSKKSVFFYSFFLFFFFFFSFSAVGAGLFFAPNSSRADTHGRLSITRTTVLRFLVSS